MPIPCPTGRAPGFTKMGVAIAGWQAYGVQVSSAPGSLGGMMQAATAASGSRLIRADGEVVSLTAVPTRGAYNLEWRPRAGNISGDTRAGMPAR